MQAEETGTPSPPIMRLVRHELKRRTLTVAGTHALTPHMLRITLQGSDLADFPSLSPDDHIKVLVDDGAGATAMRDYTPRSFSKARGELVLDFAIHDAGPATQWALDARVGDTLQIAGPRGSRVIAGDIRRWLLIGDETALPAIGRRLEEATAGEHFTILATVPGPADEQLFATPASTDITWIHGDATDARRDARLMQAVREAVLSADTFVWIATEGRLAREIRAHFIDDRGHSPSWLKAAGYWVRGEADTTVKFD